jgi:putative transposase
VLAWPWPLPQTVVIHWSGSQYEAIATYRFDEPLAEPQGKKVAGIDLGEIHMAVSHDGDHTHLLNGRHLRSKRQYRNKLLEHLNKKIDKRKKGSRRKKQLIRSKHKQLKKLSNQIKEIEHRQTSLLVSTLYQEGVQTLAIGDVRTIRLTLDVGTKTNQKLHQWSFGSVRHKLTYKAQRLGMQVVLQEEARTSKTCPRCGKKRKSAPRGRTFVCGNKACRWSYHRDGVGSINIRAEYQGVFGSPLVVGEMAPPTGLRFWPHTRVARWKLDS